MCGSHRVVPLFVGMCVCVYARSPRIRRASWMSFGMIVTRFAWMAQVGVLEEAHQVRLGSLLQRAEGSALEPQVELKVLRNLAHEPLERQLPDEELGAL